MAQVGNVSKSLTANGTAAGIVTVDDNSGFGIGAYCFISSTSVPTTNCIVLNKVGSTGLLLGKVAGYQVRGFDFSVLDVSGFLLADGAGIVQPAQLTEAITPEPVDQGGTGLDYVPYGNLVMGNDGLPMIKVAPGTSGNILLSDGSKWYSGASTADGVQSVTGTAPIAVGGTLADPVVSLNDAGVTYTKLANSAILNTKYVVGATDAPYSTITAAYNAIVADGNYPAAILIKPGTYAESLTVTKGNISIMGLEVDQGLNVNWNGTLTYNLDGASGFSLSLGGMSLKQLVFAGTNYQRLMMKGVRIDNGSAVPLTMSNTAVAPSTTSLSAVFADDCFFGSVGSNAAVDVQAGYFESSRCVFRGASTGYSLKVSATKPGGFTGGAIGANIRLAAMTGQIDVSGGSPAYATLFLSLVTASTTVAANPVVQLGSGSSPTQAIMGQVALDNTSTGAGATPLIKGGVIGPYKSVVVYSNLIRGGSINSLGASVNQNLFESATVSSLALSYDVAGGDLSGSFPNPTVAKLQGTPVSSSAPASGQVLAYNGSQWAPTNTASASSSEIDPPVAGSFTAGTPVAFISGALVACRADDATTFPCIGLWTSGGKICVAGKVTVPAGSWSANQPIYVGLTGGLSNTSTDSGANTVEMRVGTAISTTEVFVNLGNEIYNS